MAGQTTGTIIDFTKRLEWEVSREQFEGCKVDKMISSPHIMVKTNSEVSHWRLGIRAATQTDKHTNNGQKVETKKKRVCIFLGMVPGDVSLKVEVEGIGVKTEMGHLSGKPITSASGFKLKMISKIEHFNGRDNSIELSCGIDAGLYEDFLKMFNKNKITVVATLRFYMDRKDYIKKNEMEQNFLTNLRSISDLDTLADFTIICGDREFKCHRVILASRSTIFKTMLLNDRFVENRENSVTIENSSPNIVEIMLDFISKGVVPRDIEEKAIDLADRYDLQDLIKICESSLVNNLTAESVIETLISIDLHVPNSKHRQKILNFIKAEASKVVKSGHWKEFLVEYPDLVTEIFLWAALPPGEAIDN